MCVGPDVAGYHCKACKCVISNKGLQKPPIYKKNKFANIKKYIYYMTCKIGLSRNYRYL